MINLSRARQHRVMGYVVTTGGVLVVIAVIVAIGAATAGLEFLAWPIVIVLIVGVVMVVLGLLERVTFKEPDPRADPKPEHHWSNFIGGRCMDCGDYDHRLKCAKEHTKDCIRPECQNTPCPEPGSGRFFHDWGEGS